MQRGFTPSPLLFVCVVCLYLRYAWPRTPGLRLRVFACVVLLVLMRGLNLAVPITYKKLVDQLAAATAAPAGDKPSFMQLLKPW